jgi:predicted XRE-type DNA-binding protein
MAKAIKQSDLDVHNSSGNIFLDMEVRDAEERLAKAELARLIKIAIHERGLTQVQAAELLDVAQPDISDLTRGKLSRFSMERLERFLNALDLEIRIQVGPRPKRKPQAGITVEYVGSF